MTRILFVGVCNLICPHILVVGKPTSMAMCTIAAAVALVFTLQQLTRTGFLRAKSFGTTMTGEMEGGYYILSTTNVHYLYVDDTR